VYRSKSRQGRWLVYTWAAADRFPKRVVVQRQEVENDQKQGSAIHVRSEREYVPISEGQEESECTRRCDNYTESLNGGGREKREKGREMDGLLQASSRTIPWASNETSHLDCSMWPHQLQINLCQLAALASTIMVHSSNCLTNNGGARARGRARREHTPMLIGVPAPGTRFGLPGPCHPAFQRPGTPRRHLGSSACLKYPSCTAQHVCAVHLPWRLRNGCRLHHLNLQCRRRLVVSERCPAVYGSCSQFSVPRLCARVEPSGTGGTCFS
jgi:hypothetical protein